MFLLGTAGGVGPAMDTLFFCPLALSIPMTLVAAFCGAVIHSRKAALVALVLTGLGGIGISLALFRVKPSDDPDEMGRIEIAWNLLRWWVVSALATGFAILRVVRKVRGGSTER